MRFKGDASLLDPKLEAAEAYVLALRTGEVPATRVAGQHLAKDVVLNLAAGQRRNTISGYDAVLDRITGEWPNTPVYVKGFWSFPRSEGNQVKVDATFPPMGAAPAAVHLTFGF